MNDVIQGPGLLAAQAYAQLVTVLRNGSLGSGEFVSMPVLVQMLGFPLAATREAVKRADVHGILTVLPKRGVMVMRADADTTRHCLDLRAMFDQEGARRHADAFARKRRLGIDLDAIASAHRAVLAAARSKVTPDLPDKAITVDLSLHDALAAGISNPLAAEIYAINRDRIAVIQNSRPFLADRIVSAMEEHLVIIDALAQGDADAAVAAIDDHHRMTLRWWGVPETG